MTPPHFSVVLPVYNQADHIEQLVRDYAVALDAATIDWELVLVPNGCLDDSAAICRSLAGREPRIGVVELKQGGWGRAVRAGLSHCNGDVLCYTNSARTTPEMLTRALSFSADHPEVVVKAQRKIRDNLRRQTGSLLYNLECRLLFGLATWDINGTPKVFPRRYEQLLSLRRQDDLIDAEFVVTCQRYSYPLVELPISLTVRHGGHSTTRWRSALRMYRGALGLSREWRER
ncbi:MAG: glycosyltransferase family 2 protein [Sciscionella sp.]